MKKVCLFLFTLLTSAMASSQMQKSTYRIQPFPLSDVRLLDSPFRHAEDLDIQYLLELNADRLLAPYRKEAGLAPKAPNYTNWENTGLDGHIGGHYLAALSQMYAATGNAQIKERLDYMLSELKACQDAAGNGYLCGVPGGKAMWEEIAKGNIRASSFGLNDKWVPLYNIHKIFAGLRDAYTYAGSEEAYTMLIKLTDWMDQLVAPLTDEQMQDMLRSEHGGLNEIFADVAAFTGKEKYVKLARRFSHQTLLTPLLQQEDKLTGMHANTQIPKVIGFERIAEVEGNDAWHGAARFFWQTVTTNRSVSIGGNSVREHFHPANDFSSMMHDVQGPETCNTYNMLRLTKLLYQVDGGSNYMDYYEKALYNHILSTQNSKTGGFVYFTPMRSGHYRVYSQPQTSFWCCVGSGLENHARYGEMIYAHHEKDVYVNLFIPSKLDWKEQGLVIEQHSAFPEQSYTELTVIPRRKSEFTLYIRKPEWADNCRMLVNGQVYSAQPNDHGYLAVQRTWKKNDVVRFEFDMPVRVEALPDKSSYYSILYGPVVLAAQMGEDKMNGMFADDSRGGHIASGPQLPLAKMPVIVGTPDEIIGRIRKDAVKPLTFYLEGVYPESESPMELVPFYQLHECRYMVYWNLVSQSDLAEQQKKLAEQEQKQMELDAVTLDRVICGEQQPESDHFMEMFNSNTGSDEDIHWREARDNGWFSYLMKTQTDTVAQIRIVYKGLPSRDATVWVNDVKVGTLTSVVSNELSISEFALPQALQGEKQLRVKIGTATSKTTVRIYEVRLVKNAEPTK